MCGIVGYLGNREARHLLVDCLGRIEDRAHDAAGIGMVAGGKLKTLRTLGTNANLKAALKRTPLAGKIGIAHTRQAPVANASLHTASGKGLEVACSGVIDNYPGDVIADLIDRVDADLESSVRTIISLLHGTFAFVVLSEKEPDKIIAVCKGMPLVIGHRDDGTFVASDMRAISPYTRDIQVLEDGELAVISYSGVKLSKFDGTPVARPLVSFAPATMPAETIADGNIARARFVSMDTSGIRLP